MRIKRRNRNRLYLAKGSSFIELLVAAGLFSLSAGGFMSVVAFSLVNAQASRESLRATQILLDHYEALRLHSWTDLASEGFKHTDFNASFVTPNAANEAFYKGKVTLDSPKEASNSMKVAAIQVHWQSGGAARTRELTTNLSRYGLQANLY